MMRGKARLKLAYIWTPSSRSYIVLDLYAQKLAHLLSISSNIPLFVSHEPFIGKLLNIVQGNNIEE